MLEQTPDDAENGGSNPHSGEPPIQENPSSNDATSPRESRPTVLPPREAAAVQPASAPSFGYASGRELISLLIAVVLADVLIYRSAGYTGYGLFLVAVAPLILLARPKSCPRISPLLAAAMTVLLVAAATRNIWLGTPGVTVAGFLLLVAWGRTVCGSQPFVLDTLLHSALSWVFGLAAAPDYRYLLSPTMTIGPTGQTQFRKPSGVGLPLIVTAGFGLLFVLANPDLTTLAREWISAISTRFANLLGKFVPDAAEVVFWALALLCLIGLVRPLMRESILNYLYQAEEKANQKSPNITEARTFGSFRNTLIAVTILFAVYLVFEFSTLWRRDFPPGFYYAGYAHAGAAWLTVALAAASILLSAMFRGTTLADPRLTMLRKLAWIWSIENFLLAAAVINRLLIYVNFNGMTQMRVVGFLGVAAVIGGFVLVVVKIARKRGFIWLIRGDLAVLAMAILTFVLMPVDRLVHAYNTREILAGHLAPAVQITEHPFDLGGVISLIPLLKCENDIIREGIAAMLADYATQTRRQIEAPSGPNARSGSRTKSHRGSLRWTSYQYAEREFLRKYEATGATEPPEDQRIDAWSRFRDYAYQWY